MIVFSQQVSYLSSWVICSSRCT